MNIDYDSKILTRIKTSLLLLLLLLLQCTLLSFIASEPESGFLTPSILSLVYWIAPLSVFVFIKNKYSRIVGVFWVAWYAIGGFNILSSYYTLGNHYYIYVGDAAFIYIAFTAVFFGGLLFCEKYILRCDYSSLNNEFQIIMDMPPVIQILLLCFPFFWFASYVISVGYVPLFAGGDVNQMMYGLSYGPLYGFAFINVLSMLLALDKSRSSITNLRKYGYFSLFVVFAIMSISDGKRFSLMMVFSSYLFSALKNDGEKSLKRFFTVVLPIAMVAYMAVLFLRIDFSDSSRYESLWLLPFSTIGVEYRDFVFSVNNFQPGKIQNYDLLTSTFVNFINGGVLSILDVDKNKYVNLGSAYAWQVLFESDFGIRTGIVSEIYFAYEYLGLVVIFLFGCLNGLIFGFLQRANTFSRMVLCCAVGSMFLLSIMGQSDVLSGGLTVLFYFYVINKLTKIAAGKKRLIS